MFLQGPLLSSPLAIVATPRAESQTVENAQRAQSQERARKRGRRGLPLQDSSLR